MHLEFGLLSANEIRSRAVIVCKREEDLHDPRMGCNSQTAAQCPTCGNMSDFCPGHIGCIELTDVLYNILFIRDVVKLANAVTFKGRFKHTGDRVFDSSTSSDFSGNDMYELLSNVNQRALDDFGWRQRPENALISTLVVAPHSCRPNLFHNGHVIRDGITYRYTDIIRLNNILSGLESAPKHVRDDIRRQQQWYVTTLMDSNEQSGEYFRKKNDKVFFEGFKQRQTGKSGRIRANLSGKRSDYTARTVISGDPKLDVDEVGVPEVIARQLTVPHMVTSFNLMEMKAKYLAGKARWFTDSSGRRYNLKYFKPTQLKVNDILDCVLDNDDIVIMNRQPTLHIGKVCFI